MNSTYIIDKYGAKKYLSYFFVHICEFQSMKGIHVIDKHGTNKYPSYFLIHICK